MNKTKLRATILKGNITKLKQLAETYGLGIKDFLFMLGSVDWYCLGRDVIMQKMVDGKKIPKELRDIAAPRIIQLEKFNTERLSVDVDLETEIGLLKKTRQYGLRNIGILIDKICSESLQFVNPDLINSNKLTKGGKNEK